LRKVLNFILLIHTIPYAHMKTKGDIIIVEDDPDDWEVLLDVFDQVMDEHKYENRVIIFEDSTMVVDYLNECKADPFIIISDINMPFMNGYELQEKIHKDPLLGNKGTPYILMSTDNSTTNFFDNAAKSVQGYFNKPVDIDDYKALITNLLSYWKKNLLPS